MIKRVLLTGVVMLVIGFSVYAYLSETEPVGKGNMTDAEKTAFNQDLVVNVGLRNISGLVGGLGFFIIIIGIIIYIVVGILKKTKNEKSDIDILKNRLAKGEITNDEYAELREKLKK